MAVWSTPRSVIFHSAEMEAGGSGGAEWEKHVDEASGTTYFFNPRTGVSSWETPEGYEEQADHHHQQQQQEKAAASVRPARWRKFVDDASGATYYYDEANAVSRWEKPNDFVGADEVDDEQEDAASDTADKASASPLESDHDAKEVRQDKTEDASDESNGSSVKAGEAEDRSSPGAHSAVDSDKLATEEATEATTNSTSTHQWIKYVDPSSGKPYYHDAKTVTTQWETPEDFVESAATAAAAVPAGPQISAEYQAHLNRLRTERLARVTQQVLDPSGNLGKLNAILSGIDNSAAAAVDGEDAASSRRAVKADWQQHIDAQTQRYYYHNTVTGVTQWSKPDAPVVSGSEESGVGRKTVSGVNYVARAKFNRLSGKYEQLGGDDYWQNAGVAPDRAGRQMSHFFDMNELEKNREEARRKKEQLKRKNVDWKKIAAEKKAKKQKQKNEWLYND
ncbi:hypothetical protein BBJ28_00023042 [Nothophytophthora sp. Chile5]|nr:hypothetical protein BBJ28_00023042 [Nothophytophthora sp. Chile5]